MFGNTTFKKQDCEVYNFIIENKHHEGVQVNALNFPNICSPLNSKVNVNYPHLDGLELADYGNDYQGDNIDIFIGKDNYWDFVTGDIS